MRTFNGEVEMTLKDLHDVFHEDPIFYMDTYGVWNDYHSNPSVGHMRVKRAFVRGDGSIGVYLKW